MSLQEYIAERNRVDLLAETSAGQVQDSTDELRRQLRKALFEGMYIDADRYARALAVRRDSEFNQKKSGRSGSENTFRQQTDAMLVCLMKQKLEKEDDKGLKKKLETAIQSNKFTTILAAIEVLRSRSQNR